MYNVEYFKTLQSQTNKNLILKHVPLKYRNNTILKNVHTKSPETQNYLSWRQRQTFPRNVYKFLYKKGVAFRRHTYGCRKLTGK